MSQAENDRTEAEALLEELLPVDEGQTGAAAEVVDQAEVVATDAESEAGEWFDNTEPLVDEPEVDRTVQAMGARSTRIDPAPAVPVEPTPVQVPDASEVGQTAAVAAPGHAELPSVHSQHMDEEPRTRSILPLLLAGLVVIGGFAALGYWLGTRSSSDVSAEEAAEPAAPDQEEQLAGAEGDEDTATDQPDDGAAGSGAATDNDESVDENGETGDSEGASATPDDGTADDGTGDDGAADDGAGDDGAGGDGEFPNELTSLTRSELEELDLPHAVIEEGIVYVRGRVPNPAIVALTEARIEPLIGAGNYEVEFDVDPSVPIYTAAPVYVDDVVLYDFNGTDISSEFDTLLARGTEILRRYPSMTVTIVAFTDAVGTEESNLLVATERAEAVAEYWIGLGIDESRITIDARGEEGASDDDDPETAAANRRVEFIFDGLLN